MRPGQRRVMGAGMIFEELPLGGAYRIDLSRREDERGWFARVFCADAMREHGLASCVRQTNHSFTKRRGTIRGLHYQLPPNAEAKLIRCVRGAVFDVIVDLRAGSPTQFCWHGEVLSDVNNRMMYVPEGFAHGFQALSDGAEVSYQSSAPYTPDSERGIRYNDPKTGITWPVHEVIVSQKDAAIPSLESTFGGIVL